MAGPDALGGSPRAEAPPWSLGGSRAGAAAPAISWSDAASQEKLARAAEQMEPDAFKEDPQASNDYEFRFPGCIEDFGDSANANHSLKKLVKKGLLADLEPEAVEHNLQYTEEEFTGGEARVHLLRWRDKPGLPPGGLKCESAAVVAAAGTAAPRALGIPEGMRVAVKVYHCPRSDGRGFVRLDSKEAEAAEVEWGSGRVKMEVKVLELLSHLDPLASLTTPLAIFRREDKPLYGYVMRTSFYGSLGTLLHRTCHRLIPEATFARVFTPSKIAAEFKKLLRTINIVNGVEVPGCETTPPERALLLQDLSSGNILVDEAGGLVLSDPSQAQNIKDLIAFQGTPDGPTRFQATWLWGSLKHRWRVTGTTLCDPGADIKALMVTLVEVLLVGEGSSLTMKEAVQFIKADDDLGWGLSFARALLVAILKRRWDGRNNGIPPRGERDPLLSRMFAWTALLGCEDFRNMEELRSGRGHRRPSGPDMYDVVSRLAAITSQAEALGDLSTAGVLETPAGGALVRDCVALHRQLCDLTRLDDAALLPPDEPLTWLATHCLDLSHPLADAMKQQGAVSLCGGPPLEFQRTPDRSFQSAYTEARYLARWDAGPSAVAKQARRGTVIYGRLEDLGKAYRCLEREALRAVPLLPEGPARAALEGAAALPPKLEQAMGVMKLPKLPVAPAAAGPGAAGQPAPGPGPAAQPAPAAGKSPAAVAAPLAAAAQQAAAASVAQPDPGVTADQRLLPATLERPAAPAAAAVPAAAATTAGTPARATASGQQPACTTPDAFGAAAPAEAAADVRGAAAAPQPAAPAPASSVCAGLPISGAVHGGRAFALAYPPIDGTGNPAGGTALLPISPKLAAPGLGGASGGGSGGTSAETTVQSGGAAGERGGTPKVGSPLKRKLEQCLSGSGTDASGTDASETDASRPFGKNVYSLPLTKTGSQMAPKIFPLPRMIGNNRVLCMHTFLLAKLFMDEAHPLLTARQEPYPALAAAHPGLDLPALLGCFQAGYQYLEVSTSFASPNPARYEACAPVAFASEARGGGGDDLWADCTLRAAAPPAEQAAYSAAVHGFISTHKGQAAPGSGPLQVSFRLGSAALPAGAEAPWVRCSWQCDHAARLRLHKEAASMCARKKDS